MTNPGDCQTVKIAPAGFKRGRRPHRRRRGNARIPQSINPVWPTTCSPLPAVRLNKYLSAQAGSFDVGHLHACRKSLGQLPHTISIGPEYRMCWRPMEPGRESAAPVGQARVRHRDGDKRISAARTACWPCPTPNGCRSARSESTNPSSVSSPPDRSRRVQPARFARRFPPAFRAPGASDAPVVMFLGKLTPRKRVDVLVRAFRAARPPRRAAGDCRQRHGRGRRHRALVGRSVSRRGPLTVLCVGRNGSMRSRTRRRGVSL